MSTENVLSQPVGVSLKETVYDGISYVCPTWEQMGEYTFELAKKVINSGQSFDRVIAFAKGGLTWVRTLVDYLDIDNVSSVRIKSYRGVNESGNPQIIQPLTDSIAGENILMFDEVIDSGKTIELGLEYMRVMGARTVRTATLCCKPCSLIKPDYFAFSTNAWVAFPHEIREFVVGSINRWRSLGIPMEDVKNRLITIGIPANQVEYFCSLHIK